MLRTRVAHADAKIQAATAQIATLKSQVAHAHAAAHQLDRAAIDSLKTQTDAAAKQVAMFQAQVAGAERKTRQLQQQLDVVHEHHQAQDDRTAVDVQATLDQAQKNADTWFTRAVQVMQANEALTAEVATLKAAGADQEQHSARI